MSQDIRVGRWDLHATAGDTPTLTLTWVDDAGASYSLAGHTVSLWVGGTVTDPTDLTGATEYAGTISTNTATITPTIPTALTSTPMRVTLDGAVVTIGTLTPSTTGTTAADLTVTVTVDPLAFTVELVTGAALMAYTNHGNTGSSEALVFTAGVETHHRLVLNAATVTLTFTAPAAGLPASAMVELVQDATGTRAVTWPTVRWAGGVAPALSVAANAVDVVYVKTVDGGSSYLGTVVGYGFA